MKISNDERQPPRGCVSLNEHKKEIRVFEVHSGLLFFLMLSESNHDSTAATALHLAFRWLAQKLVWFHRHPILFVTSNWQRGGKPGKNTEIRDMSIIAPALSI